MQASKREVLLLLGRTLLALPVAMALWYFASPFLNEFAGHVAKPVIGVSSGGTVTTVAMRDRTVHYEIRLYPEYQAGRARPPAHADVDVNASLYTFGLALFLALSAAARASRRAAPVFAGVVALMLLPAWGVTFDALKQLAGTPELATYLGYSGTGREAIALGYQVGTLLLPTLAPIALWLGLNPEITVQSYKLHGSSEGSPAP
ncbi:hypothetical protein BWI17_15025 [Betaproteobacteria bacterium GR16-43]|nr:hypothetical protein BWI17_15025 [Betaproteobacteria bacterium GR16-43]